MALAPILVELKANIDQFQSKLGIAQSEITKLSKNGGSDLEKFASVGKAALLTISGSFAVVAAASVKQAVAQDDALAILRQSIVDTGKSYGTFVGQIDKAEATGRKLGFSNEETARSMARLTQATHDPQRAINDLQLVMDIARGRNISLGEATDLLAMVETGHVALLGRLGIATKDATGATISAEEAHRRLAETFAGAAQASAETFGGRMRELNAQAKALEAQFGNLLIPAIVRVARAASDAADFLNRHHDAAVALAVVVGGPLVAAMTAYVAIQTRAVAVTTIGFFVGLADKVKLAAIAVNGLTTSSEAAAAAVSALAVGAGAAVIGIGLIVTALQQSKQSADQFTSSLLASAGPDTRMQLELLRKAIADTQAQLDHGDSSMFAKLFGQTAQDEVNTRKLRDRLDDLNKTHHQLTISVQERAQAIQSAAEHGTVLARTTEEQAALDEKQAAGEEKLSRILADRKKAEDALVSSVKGAMAATDGYIQSQKDVASAQKAVTDAQKKLDELNKTASVDQQKLAQANRDFENASKRAKKATDDQAKALSDLMVILHPTARTLTDAGLDAAQAHRDAERAVLRVGDAQKKLNDLLKDPSATAEDIKNAQLDLADAKDGVTKATEAVTDAEKRVSDLQPENIRSTQAYKDAVDKLTTAQDNAKQAIQDQGAAADKLREAQQPDEQRIKDIASATIDLSTKQADLKDKQDKASKAAYDQADAIAAEVHAFQGGNGILSDFISNLTTIEKTVPAAAGYVQGIIDQIGSVGGDTSPTYKIPVKGAYAAGTNYHPGGLALVGEKGPELVNLPRGSSVTTASATARMLSGGGGAPSITFAPGSIVIHTQATNADELIWQMMPKLRTEFLRLQQDMANVWGSRG